MTMLQMRDVDKEYSKLKNPKPNTPPPKKSILSYK